MNEAASTSSQTANPPVTLNPRPRASPRAYVLIVIGVLSLFDLVGLNNWETPLFMIVVGFALLTRHYLWGRTLAPVLSAVGMIGAGGWYFTHPAGTGAPSSQIISQRLTARARRGSALDHRRAAGRGRGQQRQPDRRHARPGPH